MNGDLSWTEILDFLGEIADSNDTSSFFTKLFAQIDSLIPFDGDAQFYEWKIPDEHNVYEAFKSGPPKVEMLSDAAEDFRLMNAFNSYYWKIQPPPTKIQNRVYKIRWKEWERTEFYGDFVRPTGIRRSIVPAQGFRYTLALHRSAGFRPFSECEVRVLDVLAEHINNLYSALHETETLVSSIMTESRLEIDPTFLTKREEEIIRLMSYRLSAFEIGAMLNISRRTVEKHMANLFLKLNVNNKHELLRRIYQMGN